MPVLHIVDMRGVETHGALIYIIGERGVETQILIHHVFPSARNRRVAPTHLSQVINHHVILALVERDEHLTCRRDVEVRAEVHVIEIHRVLPVLLAQLQKQVEI